VTHERDPRDQQSTDAGASIGAGLRAVRRIDQAVIAATPIGQRLVQRLIEASSGTGSCTVSWIRTPAGGGSPEGLHTHPVDQIFYVLAGMMTIEIHGVRENVGAGSVVLFPAGAPHRNWNGGTEPTIHLAINAPAPPPGVPFVQRVDGTQV
jgi:mannose-6-phosphate isomerase-like protein (cupin superfamily)